MLSFQPVAPLAPAQPEWIELAQTGAQLGVNVVQLLALGLGQHWRPDGNHLQESPRALEGLLRFDASGFCQVGVVSEFGI